MGTCLTGHLECRLKSNEAWNHIMTVNFWKDYPLMHSLKELPSFTKNVPRDTTVWVWGHGSMRDMKDHDLHFDRVYSVSGEDFLSLTAAGVDKTYLLTNQTRALQAAIRELISNHHECRLVFTEA